MKIFVLAYLLSTSIYLKWRPIYSASDIEDNPENLSFLMKVIYSQQKPNIVIRSSSIFGKILFFLRFNTATQFGITFALVILFTFLNKELIIYPITKYILSNIPYHRVLLLLFSYLNTKSY